MRVLIILVLAGLMHAARTFTPGPGLGSSAAGTALACGYLLLSAYFIGSVFKSIGLPRLTGYIVTGIAAGPKVLALVSDQMVANLGIFNGAAIALIALTAGVELDLREMRPLLRSIAWIMVVAICGTACLLAGAVYLTRPLLPFLGSLSTIQTVAVAAVLGITMVAQSPAVVVALKSEMEADGPVSRTVLGVVVVSDLVVILLFATASSVAKTLFGGNAGAMQTAERLAWEIFGSIASGAIAGVLIATYMRYVKEGRALFIVTTAFVVAEVGQRIDFDPLILALTAGLLIRNLTRAGEQVQEAIEAASLPVYVTFFAVTGATIHLQELLVIGVPAIILVSVRAAGFLAGGRVAAYLAGAAEPVRRFAGFGLLPQAGLALALALLFVRTFPDFGPEASALILGAVAINEMLAPVLYRWALVRSGEAGQAVSRTPAASHSDSLPSGSPLPAESPSS